MNEYTVSLLNEAEQLGQMYALWIMGNYERMREIRTQGDSVATELFQCQTYFSPGSQVCLALICCATFFFAEIPVPSLYGHPDELAHVSVLKT